MIELVPYAAARRAEWDGFVQGAKNGLFLFLRDYLEYHAERFTDASLMAYERGRLCALLPACLQDGVLSSHAGLTFGGLVTDASMGAARMLALLAALRTRAAELGARAILYKPVPHAFCTLPAEEDLYALLALGARLARRDLSSIIRLAARPKFAKSKRQGVTRARAAGLRVREENDHAGFMALLGDALARHGTVPTHSVAEIELLAARFPGRIRLFAARAPDARLLAGAIVYDYGRVVHCQYMATSEAGMENGALDLVIEHLLREAQDAGRAEYLSFGISTDQGGRHLNEGLCAQKEMFGARAMVHDWYELDTAADPVAVAGGARGDA